MAFGAPTRISTLAALVLAVACSDATGPMTDSMSAVVNGSQFTAGMYPSGVLGLLDTLDMTLTLTGVDIISPTVFKNVILTIRGFHGSGEYHTCATSSYLFGIYYAVDELDTAVLPEYSTDSVCGGEVNIQNYLPVTSTISGTFHFAATSFSSSDTVQVTDGHFSGRTKLEGLILTPAPGRGARLVTARH